MADLNDLVGKPMSEMSVEELQSLILDIRRRRRTPPEKPKKKAITQTKTKDIPLPSVTSLGKEDAKALLALLGGSLDE